MQLFDQVERTLIGPKKYAQPFFDYLNESARPQVEAIRSLLESWYLRFPDRARVDIRSRFRSSDNRQHVAAFLELYLFALFSHLGFSVDIHTTVATSANRPDFRLHRESHALYLEATVAAPSD